MINQLADTFVALGDPTRFQVVEMLRGRELSAGEIAAKCKVSGPALSRHLRVLRKTGLVEVVQNERAELDARLRVYRLRPEPFSSVKEWVDQVQAFWMGQLNAFRLYAERGQGRPSTGSEPDSVRNAHRKKRKGRGK